MCNRMKIPTPYPGYWRQVERRKNPPKTRLGRGRAGGQTTITLVRRGVEEGPVSPFVILRRQIELEHHSDLSVPRRFGRLHPLIANAKEGLNNGPPENKSSVNIDVSPINKRYALRLLNAIILLFIKRGHHVEGNCFIIGGTRWLFSLTERLETPVDGSSPQRHKPTNVFKFKVEGYSKFVFNDTKRERLEKKLSKIVARLELAAKEQREQQLRQSRFQEERQERMRVELEEKQRTEKYLADLNAKKKKELAAFKDLLQTSERFFRANLIRSYITEVKRTAMTRGTMTEDLIDWIVWAQKKCNWYDPLVNAPDELLGDIDKITLAFEVSEKKG